MTNDAHACLRRSDSLTRFFREEGLGLNYEKSAL
jgi:hypothetical protein